MYPPDVPTNSIVFLTSSSQIYQMHCAYPALETNKNKKKTFLEIQLSTHPVLNPLPTDHAFTAYPCSSPLVSWGW